MTTFSCTITTLFWVFLFILIELLLFSPCITTNLFLQEFLDFFFPRLCIIAAVVSFSLFSKWCLWLTRKKCVHHKLRTTNLLSHVTRGRPHGGFFSLYKFHDKKNPKTIGKKKDTKKKTMHAFGWYLFSPPFPALQLYKFNSNQGGPMTQPQPPFTSTHPSTPPWRTSWWLSFGFASSPQTFWQILCLWVTPRFPWCSNTSNAWVLLPVCSSDQVWPINDDIYFCPHSLPTRLSMLPQT